MPKIVKAAVHVQIVTFLWLFETVDVLRVLRWVLIEYAFVNNQILIFLRSFKFLIRKWHFILVHETLKNKILISCSNLLQDEIIYQETRRILIGEMQNIVYGEYLPTILGVDFMKTYGLIVEEETKYDPKVDATIFTSFGTAAFRCDKTKQLHFY